MTGGDRDLRPRRGCKRRRSPAGRGPVLLGLTLSRAPDAPFGKARQCDAPRFSPFCFCCVTRSSSSRASRPTAPAASARCRGPMPSRRSTCSRSTSCRPTRALPRPLIAPARRASHAHRLASPRSAPHKAPRRPRARRSAGDSCPNPPAAPSSSRATGSRRQCQRSAATPSFGRCRGERCCRAGSADRADLRPVVPFARHPRLVSR